MNNMLNILNKYILDFVLNNFDRVNKAAYFFGM